MLREFKFLLRSGKNLNAESNENRPASAEDAPAAQIASYAARPPLNAIQEHLDHESSVRTPTKSKGKACESFAVARTPDKKGSSLRSRFGFSCRNDAETKDSVNPAFASTITPRAIRASARAHSGKSQCNSVQNTPSNSVTKPPISGQCPLSITRTAGIGRFRSGYSTPCPKGNSSSPGNISTPQLHKDFAHFNIRDNPLFEEDIKPENVGNIREDMSLQLLEFGEARAIAVQHAAPSSTTAKFVKEADAIINELMISNGKLKMNLTSVCEEKEVLLDEIQFLKVSKEKDHCDHQVLEDELASYLMEVSKSFQDLEETAKDIKQKSLDDHASLVSEFSSMKTQLQGSMQWIRLWVEEIVAVENEQKSLLLEEVNAEVSLLQKDAEESKLEASCLRSTIDECRFKIVQMENTNKVLKETMVIQKNEAENIVSTCLSSLENLQEEIVLLGIEEELKACTLQEEVEEAKWEILWLCSKINECQLETAAVLNRNRELEENMVMHKGDAEYVQEQMFLLKVEKDVEIYVLHMAVEDSELQSSGLGSKIEEYLSKIMEMEIENTALKGEMETHKSEVESFRAEKQIRTCELHEADKMISWLRLTVDKCQSRIMEMSAQKSEADVRFSLFLRALENWKEEMVLLSVEKELEICVLQESEEKLFLLQKVVEESEMEASLLRSMNDDCHSKIIEMESRNKALEDNMQANEGGEASLRSASEVMHLWWFGDFPTSQWTPSGAL